MVDDHIKTLDSRLESAESRIKKCFKAKTFAVPREESVTGNITKYIDFLIEPLFDSMELNIGWENVPSKKWPGADCVESLIDWTREKCASLVENLEEIQDPEDPDKLKIVAVSSGLESQLKRRIYNKNDERKDELKIPRKGTKY